MLVAVGVFFASLLLSGGVAEAHGKHEPLTAAVETQMKADHVAADHQSNCHGGAFCGGQAIILHSSLPTGLMTRSERFGMPSDSMGIPVVSSFDPPPPRFLI